MWNQFVPQGCGLAGVSRGYPRPLEYQIPSRGLWCNPYPPPPPPTPAGWVHPWVDTLGSSEEPRLWEETERGRLAGSRNMVSPEVLLCDLHFARNGDFFLFKKQWISLNFRPFTNIFLGEKRRKKSPTKCLSQLLTSTLNHGHKTTAMWLTKELCIFISCYWKSFSNLHYVICRQTDK